MVRFDHNWCIDNKRKKKASGTLRNLKIYLAQTIASSRIQVRSVLFYLLRYLVSDSEVKENSHGEWIFFFFRM